MKKQQSFVRKKLPAIILLLLFSYNAVFCHVSLWLWKVYMSEQIEEFATQLSNEELAEIVLPYSGNPESEIESNGEVYDVIRFEQHGSLIHYYCVKDFTENTLLSTNSDELTISKTARQHWDNHTKDIAGKTKTPFILSQASHPIHFCIQIFSTKHIIPILNLCCLKIDSPPPKAFHS